MDFQRLVRRLKRWKEVIGWKHQCPMCGYRLSTFKPYGHDLAVFSEKQVVGGGRREQAKCHICGCLDRERLIFMYLKHHTSFLTTPSNILHFAPEAVLGQSLRANKNKNYITADIVPDKADLRIDMTDIPFAGNEFDLIIANHILEHIRNDKKALSELKRVLKNNSGRAILQVPISLNSEFTYEDATIDSDEGRLQAFGQEDHIRIYGQDYPLKLQQAGFDVEIFDWKNSKKLNPNKKNKYGFIEEEKIYIVKVTAS